MTRRGQVDRVIFRIYPDGDVIALLIDQVEGPGLVTCYVHMGQHSTADYWGVIQNTRLATATERRPLQRELRTCGYTLVIRKRWVPVRRR